jgi:hypothetical protein
VGFTGLADKDSDNCWDFSGFFFFVMESAGLTGKGSERSCDFSCFVVFGGFAGLTKDADRSGNFPDFTGFGADLEGRSNDSGGSSNFSCFVLFGTGFADLRDLRSEPSEGFSCFWECLSNAVTFPKDLSHGPQASL